MEKLPFSQEEFNKFKEAIRSSESGALGKRVVNKFGYAGLYQMGAEALEDVGYLVSGASKAGNKAMNNPDNWTIEGGMEAFLDNEELQTEAFRKLTEQNYNRISALEEFKGKDFTKGDLAGLLATAHLKGVNGGAKQYLKGNITRDGFNTSTYTYYELGKNSLGGSDLPPPKKNIFIDSQRPSDLFKEDLLDKALPDGDPSFSEAFGASRRESPILKSLDRPSASGDFNTDYNPMDDITGYEEYADDFLDLPNRESVAEMKEFIDESLEQQQKQQGFGGLLGGIAYGLVSPTTLIPGIGLASKSILGSQLATRVAGGAALTGAASGLDETLLHAVDPTRTKTESILNTTASAALGGLLFGAAGGVKLDAQTAKAYAKALQDDTEVRLDINKQREVGAPTLTTRESDSIVTNPVLEGALKTLKKTSPKLRVMTSPFREVNKLANQLMEHDFLIGRNKGQDMASDIPVERIIEAESGRVHRILAEINEDFKTYRQSDNRALGNSRVEFEQEISKAYLSGSKRLPKDLKEPVKRLNKYVEDIKKKLIKNDLLTEELPARHLFRRFNISAVLQNQSKFERIIRRAVERQFDDLELNQQVKITDDITNRIMRGEANPAKYLKVKDSFLDLKNADIREFLDHDLTNRLTTLTKDTESQIAFKNAFESPDLSNDIKILRGQETQRIERITDPKKREKLYKQLDSDIRDLEAIRDRILGKYGQPADPYSLGQTATRVASSLSFMSLGGGIAVSQLADLAQLVIAARMPKFLGKELTEFGHILKGLKLSKTDLQELGIGMETWLSSRASELGDITDIHYRQSKTDRFFNAATKKFMNLALVNQMNDFSRRFGANHIANNMILDIQRWKAGTIKPKRLQDLRRLGLTNVDLKAALKQFEKHSTVQDGVRFANLHKWNKTASSFKYAIRSEIDRTILLPDAADRSLWMSTPIGKVMAQFTGFSFAIQNKILLPGLQRMDAEFLSRLMLLTFFGTAATMVRDATKGKDPTKRDLKDLITTGIDRGGVLGIVGDVHGRFARFTGLGINDLLSQRQRHKYYNRGKWAAVLGPAAGLTEELVSTLPGLFSGEPTEAEMKKLRKLMPGQNLFYLNWLMNRLDEKIEREFPKSRR